MSRFKNTEWDLPQPIGTWERVLVAISMDIRDELQRLNQTLHCHNFLNIPKKLDAIKKNTTKRKYKKKGLK